MSDPAYAAVADEISVGRPKAFVESLSEDSHGVFVYRPTSYEAENQESSSLAWFVSVAFAKGDCCVIVDEAHLLCTPWNMPPLLRNVPVIGRHKKVSMIYITQSFTMVHRSLTLNTDTFVFFRLIDPRDLNGVRLRISDDFARRIPTLEILPNAEVAVWKDGMVRVMGVDHFVAEFNPATWRSELWKQSENQNHLGFS